MLEFSQVLFVEYRLYSILASPKKHEHHTPGLYGLPTAHYV